ncbi:MAG: DNA starvation/stationary phase protection protein [Chitinivibrionales bacterium]|nr:DNA starvation/stationary phase protection protein [Chitinivibrionales bacterium]MBD3355888.1 DNA starvation/stationary phase protection protein [Chitinivibrionales bacterium]
MATVQAEAVGIGIEQEQREGVVALLTRLLADEQILYAKTRNYHWNVVGPLFHSLHELLENQYQALAVRIDEIAERTRALGAPALGTLVEYKEYATLSESPGAYPEAMTMIANLTADHESIIRHLRKDLKACEEQYDDMGTSDFLTGLMEAHEKTAWMLRSFQQQHA